MPEGDEKARLMKDFFKRENWLGPREQQRLEDMRREFGGSPITYSEMRLAAKISKEASLRQNDTIENTPIVFTPGAVE